MSIKPILILLVFAAAFAMPAFAIDIEPSVTLDTDTTYTSTSATLTTVGVDVLDNAGLVWVKLYENGVEIDSKDCAAATSCVMVSSITKTVSGTFSYVSKARDLGGFESTSGTVTVTFNHPPVLNAIGPKAVTENSTLSFVVTGSDTDTNDVLTFGATGSPAGATFNAGTQTFSWTPNLTQNGTYIVNFTLTDGRDTDWEAVTIAVSDFNQNPVITTSPVTAATEGVAYSYDVDATDPDGDSLTFALTTLPAGMTIVPATGVISWTPNLTQAGNHSVTVNVTDGRGGSVAQSWVITVSNTNQAPVFSGPIANQTWAEETNITLNLSAFFSDPDGDALTFSTSVSPSNITVGIAGGIATLTPSANFSGSTTVQFRANDGSLTVDSNVVTLTVTPVNDGPYLFAAVPDVTFVAGGSDASTNMPFYFRDVDNATLVYSYVTNNSNVSIAFTPGNFANISAPAGFIGTALVTLVASDGQFSVNDTITVTTTAPPAFSVSIISNASTQQVGLLQAAVYLLTVNNTGNQADNYTLTVQNVNAADQAALNATTTALLASGQTQAFTLTVSDSNPGLYNVTVTVSSPNANAAVNTLTNVTTADTGFVYNSTINGTFYANQSTGIFNAINNTVIQGNSNFTTSIADNSVITRSNVTNSTIINSTIVDSNIVRSNVTNSNLTNVTATDSTIVSSTLSNAILITANLTNGILYSGTITTNGTTYNATGNQPLNTSNQSAFPSVSVSFVPAAPDTSTTIVFTATISGQFNTTTTLNYSWDFDNNGATDFSAANVSTASNVYGAAATYTARVTVRDGKGSSATTTTVVTVSSPAPPPPPPPSGGGGGGGVSTTTTPTNVTTHIWFGLSPSTKYAMAITNNDIAITRVTFTVAEKLDTLRIDLKRLPDSTALENDYQYVELNATPLGKVNNAEIEFRVKAQWFADNNLDKTKTQLARQLKDGSWEYLQTSMVGENGDYVEYKSTSAGLSIFAIVASPQAQVQIVSPPPAPAPEPAKKSAFEAFFGKMLAGQQVIIPVSAENLAVVELVVTPSVTLSEVRIAADPVDDASDVASALQGAFKYFEVKAASGDRAVTDSDLESVKVKFRLSKSELDDRKIDPSSVKLFRWGENWKGLPTIKVAEDADYVTYEAVGPGFGLFAVTGETRLHPVLLVMTLIAAVIIAVVVLLSVLGRSAKPPAETKLETQ